MPHSTYSKIYDLLFILQSSGSKDIVDLSEEIHSKKIESFAIWRRAENSNESIKSYCSTPSIRRLIRFAYKLDLIEIENQRICHIQPAGVNALKGENYPVQLSTQLMKYMREQLNLPFDSLTRVIGSIKPPQIADSGTIFLVVSKLSGIGISEGDLRRLLYLLQRCGKLNAAIKKVYSA